MANLLFLPHRMPYPPNKGDKVRSYHLLKHLAQRHRVFVATFIDDRDDERHIPTLRGLCADLYIARLHPLRARVASLAALGSGQALTLRYYRDGGLARWVAELMQRERIDASIVFSSSMAPYATAHPTVPMLVDFVDVDSAKWVEYAPLHRWPLSWLYAREGRTLLAYEREAATLARHSFFATDKEARLFCSLAPEARGRVEGMSNGVDAEYFAPQPGQPSPFAADELPLVFTGAMDYRPNIDAVVWFATQVLPQLRARHPRLRFHVVGRSPHAAVRALAGDAVQISGTVPDVRPYLQHAAVVVAPLQLARGIQNKILEAMAMGRPVVAARMCVDALSAQPGGEIVPAADVAEYAREIDALLAAPERAAAIGAAGRRRVVESYSWAAHLQTLDRHLAFLPASGAGPAGAAVPVGRGSRLEVAR